jgi:hypothetical protein
MVMVTGMKMSVLKRHEQKHSNDCKSTGTTVATLFASRDTEANMVIDGSDIIISLIFSLVFAVVLHFATTTWK